MRRRIAVEGTTSAEVMWEAYADTARWASWAPHIRRVSPSGRITQGMSGVVEGPIWSRARFEVTQVDEHARRWTWRVRLGPTSLTIAHEVDDGATAVEIEGPAPLVIAYAPVAQIALARLVRQPG